MMTMPCLSMQTFDAFTGLALNDGALITTIITITTGKPGASG